MPKSCDECHLQAKQISRLLPEDTDEAIWVMSDVCDILEGREPPIKRRLSRAGPYLRNAALVTALFFFPGWEITRALMGAAEANVKPAIIQNDLHFASDRVRREDGLTMVITARFTRACSWTWTRDWRDASGVIVVRTQEPGIAVAVTEEPLTFKIKLEIPHGLKPGVHTLHAMGNANCGHEPDGVFVQNPLTFTLLD